MEKFEKTSEEEKYSYRKLCEQIHRTYEGYREGDEEPKQVLYSLSLVHKNQKLTPTDK